MFCQSHELDRIWNSEMIKLAIIYIINHRKTQYTTSVSAIAKLINSIIYEKQRLIIKEDGINICKSLFIPYNIMSKENLSDVNIVLANFDKCDFFVDSDGKNNIIYPDDKFSRKKISICNVVCGFSLSVKEMFKAIDKTAGFCARLVTKETAIEKSIFSVVKRCIFLLRRSIDNFSCLEMYPLCAIMTSSRRHLYRGKRKLKETPKLSRKRTQTRK